MKTHERSDATTNDFRWADLERGRADDEIHELLKGPVIEPGVPILGSHCPDRYWVHYKIGVV